MLWSIQSVDKEQLFHGAKSLTEKEKHMQMNIVELAKVSMVLCAILYLHRQICRLNLKLLGRQTVMTEGFAALIKNTPDSEWAWRSMLGP